MRIFAISDCHLDHHPDEKQDISKWPDADVLVLAGDIGNPSKEEYVNFLRLCRSRYKHVVFVAGNHEYYDSNYDFEVVSSKLEEIAKLTETHFLNRSTVVIDDVEFVGATLWSIPSEDIVKSGLIGDYLCGVFRNRMENVCAFIKDYTFLKEKLDGCKKRVVVTHHLPSTKLAHPRFNDPNMNTAYYTNILDSLQLHNVKLWVCGHTHESSEMIYGDTKIMVNPIGYPHETRRKTTISFKTITI